MEKAGRGMERQGRLQVTARETGTAIDAGAALKGICSTLRSWNCSRVRHQLLAAGWPPLPLPAT